MEAAIDPDSPLDRRDAEQEAATRSGRVAHAAGVPLVRLDRLKADKRWPDVLRLRTAGPSGGRSGGLAKVFLPAALPRPTPPAMADRWDALVKALRDPQPADHSTDDASGREQWSFVVQRMVGDGLHTLQVTLAGKGENMDEVAMQGQGDAQPVRYADFTGFPGLKTHLDERFAPVLQAIDGNGTGLSARGRAVVAMLSATSEYLHQQGIDPFDEPRIDDYLHQARDTVVGLLQERDAARGKAIGEHFRPRARETLRALAQDLDAHPATRVIASAQRWRLFIDAKVVEALAGLGLDVGRMPLLAFSFDGEQAGYMHGCVTGLSTLLEQDAISLTVDRFMEVALRITGQEALSNQTMVSAGRPTPEGLVLAAETIDYLVMAYGFQWSVSNPRGDRADIKDGPFRTYRPADNSTPPEVGGTTQAMLQRLVDGLGDGERLTFSRTATREQRRHALASVIDDYNERLAQALRTPGTSPARSVEADEDQASSSEGPDAPTVPSALAKLVLDLLAIHPMPNGNFRTAQTIVYLELARLGQTLAPLHDPYRVLSMPQAAEQVSAGQLAVQSWG